MNAYIIFANLLDAWTQVSFKEKLALLRQVGDNVAKYATEVRVTLVYKLAALIHCCFVFSG